MSTQPPGYPFDPSPAYWPPPAYGGPPPGYGPPPYKPGIIPLRPLTLSEIFNGGVGYIRTNPKATLGLTAAVVVVMQVFTLITFTGPLAVHGKFTTGRADELTWGIVGSWAASVSAALLVGWLGSVLLSGMLTVIVGRAVFGSPITIGETWAKIRGRLPSLFGLALLEAAIVAALLGLVAVMMAILAAVGGGLAALLLGFPLMLLVVAVMVYLYTVVLFAPVLIVLERLPVVDAVTRSFALVRNSFWRVLGIRALTYIVVTVVADAIAVPSTIVGEVLLAGAPSTGVILTGTAIASVGAALGQIITAPFNAGVIVLLYTDRRIRAEAFDLVLQSGAAGGPYATASTDNLWLTRPL